MREIDAIENVTDKLPDALERAQLAALTGLLAAGAAWHATDYEPGLIRRAIQIGEQFVLEKQRGW